MTEIVLKPKYKWFPYFFYIEEFTEYTIKWAVPSHEILSVEEVMEDGILQTDYCIVKAVDERRYVALSYNEVLNRLHQPSIGFK
jgi:hypothetical protein